MGLCGLFILCCIPHATKGICFTNLRSVQQKHSAVNQHRQSWRDRRCCGNHKQKDGMITAQFDLRKDSFTPNHIRSITLSRWSRQPYQYLRDFPHSTKSITHQPQLCPVHSILPGSLSNPPKSTPEEAAPRKGLTLTPVFPQNCTAFCPPALGDPSVSSWASPQHNGSVVKCSHQFWLSEGAAVFIRLIANQWVSLFSC